MKAASLEILEKSQLPPRQARAILEALDNEFQSREESLATRSDMELFRLAAKADLDLLRQELKAEFKAVRSALELALAGTKGELEVRIESVRSELVRWVFVVVLGQTAVLVGAAYFLLGHVHR